MIEPIARIRIELRDIEPKVRRRVDVPLSSTLLALHEIVQFTFRWTDSHLFEFEVGERIYGEPEYDLLGERRTYKATSVRLKGDFDTKARAAARMVPALLLRAYRVNFEFKAVDASSADGFR